MWDWPPAPADLDVAPSEVHVWAVDLALPGHLLFELEAVLDSGERERAARFVRPIHRDRFIAAHGQLRRLLGSVLHLAPGDIRFTAGPQGKPALSPGLPGVLEFNLAHSGDVALVALSHSRAVGVDVEEAHAMPDAAAIAARFFSAHEQAALAALPEADRQAAFFDIWTRKEAWIKAVGSGLSYPLDQFTVSLAAGAEDCLLSADGAMIGQWRLRALSTPPGYAAAVAAEGRDWALHVWGL
jgi:4'-phosphopantetheinyl transferase